MKERISESNQRISRALLLIAIFSLSLLTLTFRASTADTNNWQIGGNYNYINYQTAYNTFPNNAFAWSSTAATSGSCDGCLSMQVQLYTAQNAQDQVYQEILEVTAYGSDGCYYSYCNFFCITDWTSGGGCVASMNVLDSDNLAAAGWTDELECNSSVCSTFWLVVFGPNGFSDSFYLNDPNQAGVLSTQLNIVGACCSQTADFTGGSGSLSYAGFPYTQQVFGGSFTVEDSNMNYGSMVNQGDNNFGQSFYYCSFANYFCCQLG